MRPFTAFTLVTSGFWLLASGLTSGGQQTPRPFRAAVDLVQLDVSVLDKGRRPVKGLSAADFTVLENGRPTDIVSFEAIDIPPVATDTVSWVREAGVDVTTNAAPTRRVVLIVFDDASMSFARGGDQMVESKTIAHAVVDNMGPQDLGAVTFTDQGRRQDITADHGLLRKAIDSVVPHPYGLSCRYRGKFNSPFACVLDTLLSASEALKAAPQGRKTLVFVGPGVPFDFSMGDGRGPDMPASTIVAIQSVLKNLQEANVNVYGISPAGVIEGIFGARQDSLRMFSEDTGGRATIGTNTPAVAVPQIFRENSSYYLLAIRSTAPSAADQFRRLQVKVNRPDLEARTRSGYFVTGTKSAARRTAPPPAAVDRALGQGLPSGDLPLGVNVTAFATASKRNTAVAVMLHFREPIPAGQQMDIVTMTLDPECGECRKWPVHRQSVRLGAPAGGAAQQEVLARLSLPPGRYQIRVAASGDGRSGSVFTYLEIPDFAKDRFSGSGLAISTGPSPASQQSLLADVLPILPTARREFRHDTPVSALLRLYQGGSRTPGPVRVNAAIRDTADHIVFDKTTFLEGARFSGTRSADFSLELPISRLNAGDHLLTIEAHAGAATVKRESRFTVR